MKRILTIAAILFFAVNARSQDDPKNTTVNHVKKICEGLSSAEKPMVATTSFKVSAPNVSQQVATGLQNPQPQS